MEAELTGLDSGFRRTLLPLRGCAGGQLPCVLPEPLSPQRAEASSRLWKRKDRLPAQ